MALGRGTARITTSHGGYSLEDRIGWVAWVVKENGVVVQRVYCPPGSAPSDSHGNTWTRE